MKHRGLDFPEPVWGDTIEPKEVNWLWYPYIPAGSATMIFGPGGSGKSHISVDIASRISNGAAFPGQTTANAPQKVLMLSAEDELDRVMVPRLIKAGANLKNIALMSQPLTMDKIGLEVVEKYIERFGVGIIFIDPLVAYIGGKIDLNRANETRGFTGGLHRIAMQTGTPIVVVHHARKGNEGAEYERMMGSADFSNAVRSVLFTTQAPNGDRVMKHVKANYTALGLTWRYRFGDQGFEWVGTYKEDDEPVRASGKKRNDAAEWLKEKLSKGPVRSADIEKWADAAGFNHRTLVRAKVGLAESFLEVGENNKMAWWMKLKETSEDDQADVPVMGSKWKVENTNVEREIFARTAGRTSKTSRALENNRSQQVVGRKGPVDMVSHGGSTVTNDKIDDLIDQVLG